MNPARVAERKLAVLGDPVPARLLNFRLCFNKISRYREGAASANIEASFGDHVDGLIYQLESSEAIESMDKFESAPADYAREVVLVREIDVDSGELTDAFTPAWTYIGQPRAIADGLRPTREYIGHLLASPFMSAEQRRELERVKCLDD